VIIALFITTFALVTCAQFGISWWRAMVANVAENPLSARGHAVTEMANAARDFHALVSLHETCPFATESGQLGFVKGYYRALEALKGFFTSFSPTLSQWAANEMDVCFRYAAVRMDQRLARAHSMMAEMRSY